MAVKITRKQSPIEQVLAQCYLTRGDGLIVDQFNGNTCRVKVQRGPVQGYVRLSREDALALANALKEAFGVSPDVDERTGF